LLPTSNEQSTSLQFNKKYSICFGNINKNTYKLEPCEMIVNPKYYVNRGPKYTVNTNSLNNMKALIIGDSFTFHNSELYNLTFNTVWKFHIGHLNGKRLSNFINLKKPDVVIYQIVERAFLFNERLISEL